VFARQVVATVVALSWKRSVVIEQGRWELRRTAWKPRRGSNIRNLRTVQTVEPDIVGGGRMSRAGASVPRSTAHEVMAKHTSFEYEEFGWHKYRSFSVKGDSTADVHWPEHALEDGQRVSERRAAYHATFAAGEDEYLTELDEATWRRLRVGGRYRLKVSTLTGEVKQVAPLRGTWR